MSDEQTVCGICHAMVGAWAADMLAHLRWHEEREQRIDEAVERAIERAKRQRGCDG